MSEPIDCNHPYCAEYGDYKVVIFGETHHVCWAHVHWAEQGAIRNG